MDYTELPERILIYHAGTGKIAFVGCMKITAFFLFAANLALAGPSAAWLSEGPAWNAIASVSFCLVDCFLSDFSQGLVLGAVPMIFVTRTASPFVAFVHIRPPRWARRSRTDLMRFFSAGQIPPTTEVDLTTIKALGRPRVNRIPLGELWPVKARLGIQNFTWIRDSSTPTRRPWWRGTENKLFFVSETTQKATDAILWRKFYGQLMAKEMLK